MKGSIITGGLVGLALGALVTFALANGRLAVGGREGGEPPPATTTRSAEGGGAGREIHGDASNSVREVRPWRPGSPRYQGRRQS